MQQIRLQAHPSISPETITTGYSRYMRHPMVSRFKHPWVLSKQRMSARGVLKQRLTSQAGSKHDALPLCSVLPAPQEKRNDAEPGCVVAVLAPRSPEQHSDRILPTMSWGQFCASICLIMSYLLWCKPQLKQSEHPNCQVQTFQISCLRKIHRSICRHQTTVLQ